MTTTNNNRLFVTIYIINLIYIFILLCLINSRANKKKGRKAKPVTNNKDVLDTDLTCFSPSKNLASLLRSQSVISEKVRTVL